MISTWTKHLKDQSEKDRFNQSLTGSKTILDRLKDILTEMEQLIDRSELNVVTYDTPSWAAKQAHKNGQRATIREIKTLINLDQKETNNG